MQLIDNARLWLKEDPNLGMLLREARSQWHRRSRSQLRRHNIAMLHAGRCGSSVLGDLLNQREDIRWVGETFERLPIAYQNMDDRWRAYCRISHVMNRRDVPYFGFESKYLPEQHMRRELANKSLDEYIRLLEKLGFDRYILVDRKNHLRRAVSLMIGKRSGVWTSRGEPTGSSTIHLDPNAIISYGQPVPLLDFFAALDRVYSELRGRLLEAGHALLELSYEDHIEANPKIAYDHVCEFLGLAAQPVDVRLKKLNPKPVSELLENFDEIESLLAATKYSWMLRS